jgi:serine/threonine protein kinase
VDDYPATRGQVIESPARNKRGLQSSAGIITGRVNDMAQQKAVGPAADEVDDLIDELQPGAKLLKGQYTITRYINSGGFGITYLAKDSLDRDVVIKECFPGSVCRRSKVVVAARSRAHTAELRSVIQLFVREARSLAKIVHPNIVAVHQVFEDNGTAYMAIDFIDGLDLQQIIEGEGPQLTPEHIVRITDKLLNAVGFIHEHDMLHRDISPDNVLIDKSGEPILIDFGAAREKASQTNRVMSALRVVKDGYSPQEFYIAGSEQGPWSDIYALGATLYHLISGEAPVNGQARLAALAEDRPDPYVPLTGRFGGYPKGYLEAIDRAMQTLPKQRLQSAREWLATYRGGPVGLAAPADVDDAVHRLVSDSQSDGKTRSDATTPNGAPVVPRRISRKPEAAAASPSGGARGVQLAAGVAAALVAVAVGYMMLGGDTAPAPKDETVSIAAEGTTAPAATEAPATTETAGVAAANAPANLAGDDATGTTATANAGAEPTTAAETGTATATVPATVPATGTTGQPAATETEAATAEPVATEIETAAVEPAASETEAVAIEPAVTETGAATPDPDVTETVTTAVEPSDIQAETAEVESASTETAIVEPALAETETAAAEPAPSETATTEDAPAATEAETVAVAPETAVAETTETETAAVATEAAEVAPEPAIETEAEEAVAEPLAEKTDVATLPAPVGPPAANQIAFAVWDVDMPFLSDERMVNGQRVAVVTQIPPSIVPEDVGDWLAPGITIYAVNNTPIQDAGSLTVAILNAMAVDPDGKARVVVEYSDTSLVRQTGLLTVGAVRLVTLENGVGARATAVDGVWQTEVTAVINPEITTLQQGDVLFRDKTTTIPLDVPNALETILADLAANGVGQTSFSIIRDNKVSEAAMLLAAETGQ